MNALVPLSNGGMPSIFQSHAADLPDMNAAAAANLTAGFGVISCKGRNWRIRHRGEELLLKDERGVPIPMLEVVIVGISNAIAKQFYETGYAEGNVEAPDCYSTNGVAPDPASEKPQHTSCAACPQNRFGSKITEAGKKAKACNDSRRIAVVPSGDIMNEDLGGPLLFRVPAMSLNNLMAYAKSLASHGAQPYAVETIMKFNYDVAYPLIEFETSKKGWLDTEQAQQVIEVLQDPTIDRMLNEELPDAGPADPAAAATSALAGGAPAAVLAQPVAQPAPPPPPPVTPVQAAPAPTPVAPKPAAQPKRGAFGAAAPVNTPAQPGPAAVPQPAAQPAPPRATGFGRAAQTAIAAVQAQDVAPAAAMAQPVTVIQGVPDDMAAQIDKLLGD